MQALILPHSVVTVMYVDPKSMATDTRPFTSNTTVKQVQKGCLSVVEVDSRNGLGKITCVANSGETGTYWYEYRDRDDKPKSFTVVSLTDANNMILKLKSFID